MPLPELSLTAQWATVGIFALAFAGLFITVGINVARGLRRPVIEDQPEHWADDCPWPLARRVDSDANAGAGSGDNSALNTLSFHNREQ